MNGMTSGMHGIQREVQLTSTQTKPGCFSVQIQFFLLDKACHQETPDSVTREPWFQST